MKHIIITITNNISFDQRMIRIAESLSKRYNVTLVGSNTRNPPILKTYKFNTHRINTFFQSGFLFYLEFNFRLLYYFYSNVFEIIYSVDLDTILPATLYCRLRKKIKHVFDSHEYFTELPELENRKFVKKIWEIIGKFSVPKTDLCFSVNEVLSKELSLKYGKTFYSIRNITKKSDILIQQKDHSMILYQGAVNVGRGLEEMILVMKHFPDHIFYIVGDGPEKSKLEQVKNQNTVSNVRFLGKIEPHLLSSYTAQAYIGANLLENKSKNYYYSLANKFFDYTANQVPSLNMDFPAYNALNEKHEVAVLIPNLKLNTIKEALNKLIFDKNFYNSLKSNCKVAGVDWTWESEEKKLLKVIHYNIFNT